MKTYYHGTSADNLQDILKNGLRCDTDKSWSCSQDGIYLWDVEELAIANGRDLIEDADYIEDEAFRQAGESGQIACSKATDCRIVVLKVELDENELNEDTSCENMEGSGAKVLYRDVKLSEIKEIKVSCDLSLLKGYFIAILFERDYNNVEFSKIEIAVAEAFKKSEIYPDDIDDLITYENVEISNLVLC